MSCPDEAGRGYQGHTFLSADEKAKLVADARAMGMTQSAYIRYLIVRASAATNESESGAA
ncbi:ribbon-helix-helix DNA binding domain protein [Gordonia phage LilyPad]|nr:ribbon-helix-helix DNA binding domain protein [Gordonia phage LilyPad]